MEDKTTIYQQCYDDPTYKMGNGRKNQAKNDITNFTNGYRSLLDVGCGRGEMLDYVGELGYTRVKGTETVPDLIANRADVQFALATDLPFDDDSFAVVTMLDVIEHIPPISTYQALYEINRVASRIVYITANNTPSWFNGEDLHINKRSYEEWNDIFNSVFGGKVTWLPKEETNISETWLIQL